LTNSSQKKYIVCTVGVAEASYIFSVLEVQCVLADEAYCMLCACSAAVVIGHCSRCGVSCHSHV